MAKELRITSTGGISAAGGLSGGGDCNYFACSVGIGTNKPSTSLDVAGTIRMTSSLRVNNGSNKLVLFGDSSKLELHAAGSDGIIFKNNANSETIRIDVEI